MLPLNVELRKLLENAVPQARDLAEAAAGVVLTTLAVDRPEPYPSMTQQQRQLRNALRARARQLGNGVQADGLAPLREEIAYQQWHRMVFASFLAKNNLLMHTSGVPVTLKDCDELAPDEGELDGWAVAAKYASAMLPGIFRPDDPVAQVRMAPEGQRALEGILETFPPVVFTADDSLGWMYQFWQSRKKEEVNRSERKIGGADISPVTQLFTEDYMVRFLLENSLGAWWAGKHPNSPLLKKWDYLRFKPDGEPASGIFPGWPLTTAEVTLMDPCCGSGHFLVAGFEMLVQMRMEEEGLDEAAAAEAVLRDNIFGLELDPRCTQIAAFALALAAWKRGGYRKIPVPNVACSGIPVQGQLDSWLKLAGDDMRLKAALERLYTLFTNAPDLGSLINPADLPRNELFTASFIEVAPLLEKALQREKNFNDPASALLGASAEGVIRAANLLTQTYALVITNVPYLGNSKQSDFLKEFFENRYPDSKNDLATVFIERSLQFLQPGGTSSLVSSQYWLFLKYYKSLRKKLLQNHTWNIVVRLGPRAFKTISGEVVNVGLFNFTKKIPDENVVFMGLDVSEIKSPEEKALLIKDNRISFVNQLSLLKNKLYAISLGVQNNETLLSRHATVHYGSKPGQTSRVIKYFWEITSVDLNRWMFMESTPDQHGGYTGKNKICYSLSAISQHNISEFGIRGKDAWENKGIIVSKMSDLPCAVYIGNFFDDNTYVILPNSSELFTAIHAFITSNEFSKLVRQRNQKLAVDTGAMINVPFDLDQWQKIAETAGPLPEPHSDDPTQWLFEGHPVGSTEPLQVAIARLLGYRWPEQKADALDDLADEDGIVCLPSAAGEQPLADRLREVLAAAYGKEWSPKLQAELLANVGATGKRLGEWLRDDFFTQHCKLLKNRPFIWHVWDGRKDGFSALINYHKLDAARLDKLIYTYLGDWIRFQRARRDHGEPGADGRLVAALELEKKLKLIKEGEPPYDIYIRWKPLFKQSLGWNPDLNDGIRLNIRPFVTAGVLRRKFTVKWNKDPGKNPDGSERLNDLHYTLAEKRSAR